MSTVCILCFSIAAAAVVTSRSVNGPPDDGSCVRYVCSKYPLRVLSRYVRGLSVGCKLWAAGRCVTVTCCRWWNVLQNVRRQSNKIMLLAEGLLPAAVTVIALNVDININIIDILEIHNTLLLPKFLYGSENWTLTDLQR